MLTLTMRQIKDLAEFAGMTVNAGDFADDEMDCEYVVTDCPEPRLLNDGEPGDSDTYPRYALIAYCADYPEEGSVGLGPELPPNYSSTPK